MSAAIRASRRCWCRWWSASDGLTVLLTQRADHLTDHAGQISFPGGRHEPDDADATATALREAEEEVGLAPNARGSARRIARVSDGHRFSRDAGRRRSCIRRSRSKADALEVAEVFEVPLAFLMNPANHEVRVFRWEGGERRFFAMPYPSPHRLNEERQRVGATISSGARRRACCAISIASSRPELRRTVQLLGVLVDDLRSSRIRRCAIVIRNS